MQEKLFKKSSLERFSSPEKLNDYIRVANPSSWMILGAALALLLGVLIWGFFGVLTEEESFSGLAEQGMLSCYVTNGVASVLEKDMEVSVVPMSDAEDAVPISGRIVAIADRPLSYEEATEGLESDYLKAALGISSWNIKITISVDEPLYEGFVYSVSAVTDTSCPAELIFR